MNVKALLLMGGSAERFGSSVPKQFHPLGEKKLYLWALETLITSELFTEIFLVCHIEWISRVEEEIKLLFPSSFLTVVQGGNSRQASSYEGLLACGPYTDIVLIHDAARPFVTQQILKENVEKAKVYGAVDTCISASDTIVYAPNAPEIASIPPRSHFFLGQTPQTFSYPLILQAHEKALLFSPPSITDDGSLILLADHPLHIVRGAPSNFKITTLFDLQLAQEYIKINI